MFKLRVKKMLKNNGKRKGNAPRLTPKTRKLFGILALIIGIAASACGQKTADFEISENQEMINITVYRGAKKHVKIPKTINGLPVIAIGGWPGEWPSLGFTSLTRLTSLTIPDSVTSIREGVFSYCFDLTTINVDADNKTYISDNGVLYNKNKTVLHTYPAGKTKTSFTIPNSVKSIGYSAFSGCTSLKRVTIPDSVKSIGYWAFSGCHSITSITIPNSVTNIGDHAFYGCNSITAINIADSNNTFSTQDGVLYNKNKTYLHTYLSGKPNTSFTIPDSVTSIGDGAFSGCTSLKRVTIPDSVKSIGDRAFSFCTSLTSVTISNSVTSIGADAFWNCPSLTSVTIPDSVTSIGSGAFSWCTGLTSVTFATGSNISSGNFSYYAFPEGSDGFGGYSLRDAYHYGKAGTYKRAVNGDTWTKQ